MLSLARLHVRKRKITLDIWIHRKKLYHIANIDSIDYT